MNIESTFHRAFPKNRPPPAVLFGTANDEGAGEVLSNVRWEDVRPEQLRTHSAVVNFLTPPAFAYFLPALAISSLSEPGLRDSLLGVLVPLKGDVTRPSFAAWWSLLSPPQKGAVLDFLDHCIDKGHLSPSAAVDALKSSYGPNTSLERTRER